MSELWVPGVPRYPCLNPGGPINLCAGVVHKTIGVWPGDCNYVQANSLAHFTIGPESGQWAQHAPVNVFLAHCNGANRRACGIEFSDLDANGPLTAWQSEAWAIIRDELEDDVPDVYLDPDSAPRASVWVNGGTYAGWISHYNVRTDDGSVQHTDSVPYASYTPGDDDMPVFSEWPLDEVVKFGKFVQEQVLNALNTGTGAGQKDWAGTSKATLAGVQANHNDLQKVIDQTKP